MSGTGAVVVSSLKRYFDKKTGEWRASDYFFANDLPRLCLVAQRAFEFVVLDDTDHE